MIRLFLPVDTVDYNNRLLQPVKSVHVKVFEHSVNCEGVC